MAAGDTTAPLSDAPALHEAASSPAPKLADATPSADATGDAQKGDAERAARLAHKAALRKSQRALKRAKVAGSPPPPVASDTPGDAPGDTKGKPKKPAKRPNPTAEEVAEAKPEIRKLWATVNKFALKRDPHLCLSESDLDDLAEGTTAAAVKWIPAGLATPEGAAVVAVLLCFVPKVMDWAEARAARLAAAQAAPAPQLQAVAA